MSDNDGKKTLGLRGGSRSGNVKQSFSHGRTKNVVVETKRKRVVVPKPGAGKPAGGSAGGQPGGSGARRPAGISDAEMQRRLKALQAAKAREAGETAKREAAEKARAEERDRMRAEKEQKEREQREAEEAARRKAEEKERVKREAEDAVKRAAAAEKAAAVRPVEKPAGATTSRPSPASRPAPAATPRKNDREREDRGRDQRGRGDDSGRRSGKLTLNQALTGGEGGRQKSLAAMKRKQERARQESHGRCSSA